MASEAVTGGPQGHEGAEGDESRHEVEDVGLQPAVLEPPHGGRHGEEHGADGCDPALEHGLRDAHEPARPRGEGAARAPRPHLGGAGSTRTSRARCRRTSRPCRPHPRRGRVAAAPRRRPAHPVRADPAPQREADQPRHRAARAGRGRGRASSGKGGGGGGRPRPATSARPPSRARARARGGPGRARSRRRAPRARPWAPASTARTPAPPRPPSCVACRGRRACPP